jgi:hypothetical protein
LRGHVGEGFYNDAGELPFELQSTSTDGGATVFCGLDVKEIAAVLDWCTWLGGHRLNVQVGLSLQFDRL